MSLVAGYRDLLARWRWSLLLGLLLASFLVQPLLVETPFRRVIGLCLFALVFGGAISIGRVPGWFKAGAALLLLLGLGFEVAITRGAPLQGALPTVALLVVVAALVATFSELIGSRDPSLDSLVGAIFGYFLIAAAWGLLYHELEIWRPGSFRLVEVGEGGEQLLYFSVITLTTVGYGDITPVTPSARTAAALEAVTGTLYIAILIGRIVSRLRLTQVPPDPDEPSGP
jgi:hypothetical protein